ncbi:hypothetical protein [Nostoc sp. FACHB-888]|uniref:hypothetical protein n=1 Tax=Nostoc sp. FACHB-888 TaxID=2692842 RepID=UPI0019BEE748|nr:hypothetical protein [Nostoc sp. FACHB-888]MBD2249396.1 hypothetical protein [Nostoc sp. FACHB-888]
MKRNVRQPIPVICEMLIRHDVAPDNYLANEADYPAVFPGQTHLNIDEPESV